MLPYFYGPEFKKDIRASRKEIVNKLRELKGKQIKLIKFEIYKGLEWIDYSLCHPQLNKIRIFDMKSDTLVLIDNNGNKDNLGLSNWGDTVEYKDNKLTLIYDDLNRTRVYKGRGVKLTYEFIN